MAAHRRTVQVKEVFKTQTLWVGEVEIFWLTGHPQAKRCYAWASSLKEGQEEFRTVLEIPPVIGPATAVRAALESKTDKIVSH